LNASDDRGRPEREHEQPHAEAGCDDPAHHDGPSPLHDQIVPRESFPATRDMWPRSYHKKGKVSTHFAYISTCAPSHEGARTAVGHRDVEAVRPTTAPSRTRPVCPACVKKPLRRPTIGGHGISLPRHHEHRRSRACAGPG